MGEIFKHMHLVKMLETPHNFINMLVFYKLHVLRFFYQLVYYAFVTSQKLYGSL